MVTKVKKWGNSLGIRIPKAYAMDARIHDGIDVEITQEGLNLVISPKREKVTLKDLLNKIDHENIHQEISTGRIRGNEVW